MYRSMSWPLTVINDYPTECTIDNLLVVAANASSSSAACAVCPCSWTCLWRLYLHQSLAEWLGVCHPRSWLCRSSSSAGIAFSLHLAEPVDWLLYEYRLGEICNETFVRPSILLLNWKFYFSQSNAFNLARLTSTLCMHFPEQAKIKLLCAYARMGTMYVFTWNTQWEHVHVCVSKFQMYSIYQPHYPYVIDRHQNSQPYSKQFSQLILYGLNSPLHKDF